jgi:hypothetical protein
VAVVIGIAPLSPPPSPPVTTGEITAGIAPGDAVDPAEAAAADWEMKPETAAGAVAELALAAAPACAAAIPDAGGDAAELAETDPAGWDAVTAATAGTAIEPVIAMTWGCAAVTAGEGGDAVELAEAVAASIETVTVGGTGTLEGRKARAVPVTGSPGRSHPVVLGAARSRASCGVMLYTIISRLYGVTAVTAAACAATDAAAADLATAKIWWYTSGAG